MAVHYYNVTNNTGSPILLPSNQIVDATATVQITLHEYRSLCEKDDIFLDQIYSGDLSITFGAGDVPVHVPIPSDGIIQVLRDTDKIRTIEVDDSNLNPSYYLTYRQDSDKIEYRPVSQFSEGSPDSTSELWIDINHSLVCFYDEDRGKWLSSTRNVFAFGKSSLARNIFLNVSGVAPASSDVGYFIFRWGTITGVWVKVSSMTGSSDPYMEIRTLDGDVKWEFMIPSSTLEYVKTDLNIDLHSGDVLQCYVRDRFTYPVVQVEVTWRCGTDPDPHYATTTSTTAPP
jgi:hypothetical protein